jgi:S1-C subfamily serine protease
MRFIPQDAARGRNRVGAALAILALGLLGSAHAPAARTASGSAAAPASAAPAGPGRSLDAACVRARRSVVTVLGLRTHEGLRSPEDGVPRPMRSLASGFVIDHHGHIVTAASVVRDCDRIQVRFEDGRTATAMLLGTDEASDIALLEVPITDVPALRWAPEPSAPVGSWVAAVGPGAMRPGTGGSGAGVAAQPSFGTVQRRYEQPLGSLLLLTNEVFPGFSGAPAVNARGELVGLVVGRLADAPADWISSEGETAGTSFALAADDLKTVLEHLERYGRVRRGFLGVRMVQGEIVDSSHPDDPFKIGVRVEDVLPGSPAAQVGLRAGDLVVGWNGETLASPEDLMRRVEGSPPGTIAALVWVRADERIDGSLVVGAKPDDELLATPGSPAAGGSILPEDRARSNEELLERVRTLRSRGPGASPDSVHRVHPG